MMKATFRLSAATAALIGLAGLTAIPVTPALADSDNAATVIHEGGCTLLAADSGLPNTLFTEDSHAVVTNDGNTVLTCRFDIPEGDEPGSAIVNEGFLCGTYAGATNDSRSVATPGGRAILVCRINGSSS